MKVLLTNSIRSSLLVAMALAIGSILTPACGGEDDPKTVTADKYADLASFCNEAGSAACNADVIKHCSADSAEKCSGDFAKACRQGATFIYEGGTTHYNKDVAGDCVTELKKAIEDAEIDQDEFAPLVEKCSAVFSPRLGAGTPCTSNFDCDDTNDLKCLTSKAGTRKCVKPVSAGAGQECDAATTLCPDGFYCSIEEEFCRAQAKVGKTCVPQFDSCASGLRCETDGAGASTCVAKLANNAECSANDECETGICEPAVQSKTGGYCSVLIDIASHSPSCSYFDGL